MISNDIDSAGEFLEKSVGDRSNVGFGRENPELENNDLNERKVSCLESSDERISSADIGEYVDTFGVVGEYAGTSGVVGEKEETSGIVGEYEGTLGVVGSYEGTVSGWIFTNCGSFDSSFGLGDLKSLVSGTSVPLYSSRTSETDSRFRHSILSICI